MTEADKILYREKQSMLKQWRDFRELNALHTDNDVCESAWEFLSNYLAEVIEEERMLKQLREAQAYFDKRNNDDR